MFIYSDKDRRYGIWVSDPVQKYKKIGDASCRDAKYCVSELISGN